jgi:hypothetical protein
MLSVSTRMVAQNAQKPEKRKTHRASKLSCQHDSWGPEERHMYYIQLLTTRSQKISHSHTLPILFNFLMPSPNPQPPAQRKEKDEREWTTPEQKAHLLSKQAEYSIAHSHKSVSGRFTVELQTYFDLFPTEAVTVGDDIKRPGLTFEDKRRSQEVVSDPRLNRTMNTHLCANRGSKHGLKMTIVLQREHGIRTTPSNSKTNLKCSVTCRHSRRSITRNTTRSR